MNYYLPRIKMRLKLIFPFNYNNNNKFIINNKI